MKKIVYVVEDNPVQQKILQVHFEQMVGNYAVQTFSHPWEMMSHLKEKPFAVVLDHFFGEKDKTGLDFLKELRKKKNSVPVIYYTTLNDDALKKQVLELGAADYIIKDAASLVRLRTVLDAIDKKGTGGGFLKRLFKR